MERTIVLRATDGTWIVGTAEFWCVEARDTLDEIERGCAVSAGEATDFDLLAAEVHCVFPR